MIYLTCAAFINGDVVRLLSPYAGTTNPSDATNYPRTLKPNAKDEQCGEGSASERKYLFLPLLLKDGDIFETTKCVAKCPLSTDINSFGEGKPYDSEPCILLSNKRL
jgi:hypothetical protein